MKRAYWVVAALLATHEVDSGFWREWELFRLPGGPDLFVALHVGIFLLILWGHEQVLAGRREGAAMSLVLGAGGVVALGVHAWFLAHGDARFASAVSIGVLTALGCAGGYLVALAAREIGSPARAPLPPPR
jgi:hypothetical protein